MHLNHSLCAYIAYGVGISNTVLNVCSCFKSFTHSHTQSEHGRAKCNEWMNEKCCCCCEAKLSAFALENEN